MRMNRHIFVSAPRDVRLDHDPIRLQIKRDVVQAIEELGYVPSAFLTPAGGTGLAVGGGWSPQAVLDVAKRCVGAVLIGVPFWRVATEKHEAWLASDYCSHEGAVAHALGLPVLAVSLGIEGRGFFDEHVRGHRVSLPFPPSASWIASEEFTGPLHRWSDEIQGRPDVFFGYCSKSANLAAKIHASMSSIGTTVRNWAMDFRAGRSILEEISDASLSCSCGVFLFSEDDRYGDATGEAAPRDNVIFESGYFMARGHDRCLIIRHGEPRMPADLGGEIYLQLPLGADVSSIKAQLHGFLQRCLQ